MSIASGVAIYFLIWWLVLFAVLPFGVRTQAEEGDIIEGTAHSAPMRPFILRKVLATTLVSGVIFAVLVWIYRSGIVTLDTFSFLPTF